jgi:acyl-CoA thioester hydrolase
MAAFEKRIEIRWADVDAYQHVNNAVYLNYLEEGRDAFMEQAFAGVSDMWAWVLARVAIDFRRELRLEDDVAVVSVSVARIGNASLTLREEIRSPQGWLAAEAESVVVARDQETGASRPMTDAEREALERARTPV